MKVMRLRGFAILLGCVMFFGAGAAFAQTETPQAFLLDIKPGSCLNPVNLQSKGVIPMVILGLSNLEGFEDLDVAAIDTSAIQLTITGHTRKNVTTPLVLPVNATFYKKAIVEDVASPESETLACDDEALDGIPDLLLRYRTQDIFTQDMLKALMDAGLGLVKGDLLTLTVTATFGGGKKIEGSDQIFVQNVPKLPKPKKK